MPNDDDDRQGDLFADERLLLARRRREQFLEYHRRNPQVYSLFERFALEAKARRPRFSSDTIVHRIRWYTAIETDDPEGFKVNDRWTSFYVRLAIRRHPELDGFFELRRSIADLVDLEPDD